MPYISWMATHLDDSSRMNGVRPVAVVTLEERMIMPTLSAGLHRVEHANH